LVQDTNTDGITRKIGKITKIYFGAPYEKLTNIDNIKEKHPKLKKYLECKKELKKYLDCEKISYEDYKFDKKNKK
jgi:hypothetical protein